MTYLLAGATLPPPPAPASGVRSRPSAHRKVRVPAPPATHESVDLVSLNGDQPGESIPESGEVEPFVQELAPQETFVQESVVEMDPVIASPLAIDNQVAASPSLAEAPALASNPLPAAKEAPPVVPNEPLLFDSLQTIPPPRSPARVVAPPRTVAKSAAPVVEELFLSL
jgi:hypothetical protein